MAPLPKPPGQRRRRNVMQAGWRNLPVEGRAGAAPSLPKKSPAWLKSTRTWWAEIWRSPMATVWEPADVDGLERLARLKDEFDRGRLPISALRAIQALEDRYGLNPKSRRALQWSIGTPVEAAVPRPGPPTHLRAV